MSGDEVEKMKAAQTAAHATGTGIVKVCPHCGYKLHAIPKGLVCPSCHQPLVSGGAVAKSAAVDSNHTGKTKPSKNNQPMVGAKLVQLRRLKKNVEFPIHSGVNIIGRMDPELPSDIAIEGDLSISRRCATIEAKENSQGVSYKFTVQKTTNPIYHNGKELAAGEAVYLNYGDILVFGTTKIRFEKA